MPNQKGRALAYPAHPPSILFEAGVTTVTVPTPTGPASFRLDGDYTGNHVPPPPDLHALNPKDAPPCFAAGTRILTETGEIPVEHLHIGDRVVLADGGTAPVVFIGHRRLDLARHKRPNLARPIKIPAGALGEDIPSRDLLLSPDHALYLNGMLVPARDLVDGLTIRQDRSVPWVHYYHVELPRHAILIAEGAAAESFLDIGQRGLFDNAGNPPIPAADLMTRRRKNFSRLPIAGPGAELTALRSRLHARALMRGHKIVEQKLTCLKIGNHLLAPDPTNPDLITFHLPPQTTHATLLSPVFTPAETDPTSADRRTLGLAIADTLIDGQLAPPHHLFNKLDLHPGDPREPAAWTRGPARLTLPPTATTLALRIATWPRHWQTT